MSGLIEQLETLRAVGVDGDEKKLQLLLQTANYNVERAINQYFDSGFPDPHRSSLKSGSTSRVEKHVTTGTSPPPANAADQVIGNNAPVATAPPPLREGPPLAVVRSVSTPGNKDPGWPKFVGERWVTGYSVRGGNIEHREYVAIISEGSGISSQRGGKRKVGSKGSGAQQSKRGQKGGAAFGRHKGSSTGAMAHILFRSSKGGVEGRLPREVCAFLAPLLRKGLVKAHAEAVCDLPGLGVFAEVPLTLSIDVEERLFDLDPVEDEELYRSAYALLEFAHTGHIEQEQLRVQQASPQGVAGAGSRTPASTSGSSADRGSPVKRASDAPAAADGVENEGIWEVKDREGEAEKEVRDEDVKELYDDEAQLCGMPEAPDPKLFVEGLTLRRYQRQALAWMVQREKRRLLTEEEDCTALSLGGSSARPVEALSVSDDEESIVIRGGRVHVASWKSPAEGGDCGGGPGVPMHPLWERRAVASLARKSPSSAAPPPNLLVFSTGNGKHREGLVGEDGEASGGLSHPVAFYVNVYSRRFQREFPRASLGCRGGILADEMGMGKTVMLLSLILKDKERRQRGYSGEDGEGEDECMVNITSLPVPAAKNEWDGRGCSGQQQSFPLLPKAVACLEKQDEVAGHFDGDLSHSSSGGGERGVENTKLRRRKRGLDAASASAFAADPGTAGTKRRREEALENGPMSAPGGAVMDVGEGAAATEYCSSSFSSSISSGDDTDDENDPDFKLNVSKSKKVRPTPTAKRDSEADGASEGEGRGVGRKLGGRWGGGKAGSDPSALLQDPYHVDQRSERVKGGADDGAAAVKLRGGNGPRPPSGSEANGGTLVVCPLSLIGQWRGEIESKTRKGVITVCFHYGSGRNSSVRDLCRFDVVLTTYGVISSEMAKHEADIQARAGTASKAARGGVGKRRPGAGLLGLRWRRVILDEAHSIRNTATEQSRACLLLEAEQRWAVTGTPIQNSLDDVAALLAFLRHEPWSDRGWWRKVISDPYKGGDMEALRRLKTVLAPIMLRRTKKTLDSRGRPIVELPWKKVEIVRLEFSLMEREFYQALKQRSKVEFEGYVAAGTVMKSYIAILTLLLRLRQACNHPFLVLGKGSPAVAASAATGELHEEPLSNHPSKSRDPNHALGGGTSSKSGVDLTDDSVDTALEGAEDARNKTPPYVEELYQRYFCQQREAAAEACTSQGDAGRGRGSLAFLESVVEKLREDGDKPSAECPVCMEQPMIAPALTTCAHLMCKTCLQHCLRDEPCCPVCRAPMKESDIIDISESQTTRVVGSESATRSKASGLGVRSVLGAWSARAGGGLGGGGSSSSSCGWMGSTKLERLELELREMKRERAGAKAVVFSQWTYMLDLAEKSLSREGWTFRRLDGSMTQQKRESALKSFSTDESVTVMLVSLKAGGVGLNLTAASTVVLLDPWWNPAVEEQAIDRIHRLGQLNDVSVKRFVVSHTVEDKMLALQEVKGRMAKSALASGSLGESQKLRVEDLVQFFK